MQTTSLSACFAASPSSRSVVSLNSSLVLDSTLPGLSVSYKAVGFKPQKADIKIPSACFSFNDKPRATAATVRPLWSPGLVPLQAKQMLASSSASRWAQSVICRPERVLADTVHYARSPLESPRGTACLPGAAWQTAVSGACHAFR